MRQAFAFFLLFITSSSLAYCSSLGVELDAAASFRNPKPHQILSQLNRLSEAAKNDAGNFFDLTPTQVATFLRISDLAESLPDDPAVAAALLRCNYYRTATKDSFSP